MDQLQFGHITPDSVLMLNKVITSFPNLFSGDKLIMGAVPRVCSTISAPPIGSTGLGERVSLHALHI